MQPKNSMRTDAIKNGEYIQIETLEDARRFIYGLLEANMQRELKAAEQAVNNALQSVQSLTDIKRIVEAPDVFVAAAGLGDKTFF